MDIEKEQLKLQIVELKQAVLHYQHRDLVANIESLAAAQNAAPAMAGTSAPAAESSQ